jgi:hypothetical protein
LVGAVFIVQACFLASFSCVWRAVGSLPATQLGKITDWFAHPVTIEWVKKKLEKTIVAVSIQMVLRWTKSPTY